MTQKLKQFYSSIYYPILVAVLVLLGHCLSLELLFGGIMILTVIVAGFVAEDFRYALLPFLSATFLANAEHSPNVPNYSLYYIQPKIIIPAVILLAMTVASVVVFAIRNRKNANKLQLRHVLISMLIFCASVMLNGAFSANYTVSNFIYSFSFILAMPVLYLFLALYVKFDSGIFEHLMYCFMIVSFLICGELLFAYGTYVQFTPEGVVKESVVLGWGVWMGIGGMLTFLLPASMYFAASHKYGWLGLLAGCFELFCILLTQGRAALLVGSAVFALCLLLLCFVGKYKKRNRIVTLSLVAVGVVGVILLRDKFLALINNFLNYGFGDNGRFDLWKLGIDHFLQYPVFGSGFYDSFINEEWLKDVYPYFYHNTLVQMLGACGIVGFCAYLYHRFCTVRLVLQRPSIYKSFLGLGILGFVTISLIDVMFFNTYPTIFYTVMLLFMEKSEEF